LNVKALDVDLAIRGACEAWACTGLLAPPGKDGGFHEYNQEVRILVPLLYRFFLLNLRPPSKRERGAVDVSLKA